MGASYKLENLWNVSDYYLEYIKKGVAIMHLLYGDFSALDKINQ
jgi:hypothetical protein